METYHFFPDILGKRKFLTYKVVDPVQRVPLVLQQELVLEVHVQEGGLLTGIVFNIVFLFPL